MTQTMGVPNLPKPQSERVPARRTNRGFTLIELMIVVAIVAILAAIALPSYRGYIIRAQVAEGISLSTGAQNAVADYLTNYGKVPPSNSDAGLADPTDITGQYVQSVDVDGTDITITFGNKANAAIQGKTVNFVPIAGAGSGSIEWDCSGGTVDVRYRPSACRP